MGDDSVQDQARRGEDVLAQPLPQLVGQLNVSSRHGVQMYIAAIDIRNREATVAAMTHLAGVIEKASKATKCLSRVGAVLTAVIAFATLLLAIRAFWPQ